MPSASRQGRDALTVRFCRRAVLSSLALAVWAFPSGAQSPESDLDWLLTTPGVSGYEQELGAKIRERLKEFSSKTDNLGNVIVTLGSGAPLRLIVTPMDEPGYVVSAITADGYLRVQRLPQQPPNAVFDTLHFAQPAWVMTRSGRKVSGVVAGLSVHLQPLRQNAPKMNHPDDIYVDIGASSAAEIRAAGVNVLDPIALQRERRNVGSESWTAPAAGDRFGCLALVELLERLDKTKLRGTLTVAFVAQQWTGGRGLDRLLLEIHPDEMMHIGRLTPPRAPGAPAAPAEVELPRGVLLGATDPSAPLSVFAAELKALADKHRVPFAAVAATPPRIAGSGSHSAFPERFAQLGIATRWPVTPAETVSDADMKALSSILLAYAADSEPERAAARHTNQNRPTRQLPLIGQLVEVYGASGHEAAVREKVQKLLPKWAKTETDAAGNLLLHLGDAKPGAKTPRVAFVAHMDEIGYEVKSVEPDGRLQVSVLGGGFTEYFLGHPVLVHLADGNSVGGVLELPRGWDQPNFEWPHGPRTMDEPVRVYVGAHSAEETQKLGIKPGDWVTIPKEYRPLLGTRANGRSFDDRVGCAALIEAVRTLGPALPGRDVTFIWSTEEEVGLKGAAAAAQRLAEQGRAPDFVFAIDTFVSSDSPLESTRFADAEIGKGFVVRAVDNSNITRRDYVDRVVRLARENKIPAQFGATGGGNDGSVFLRYGSVDVPLGWPLRYSHSPGEVIDTRDLDALARIVAVLAKSW